MRREEFLKICGSCIGGGFAAALLQSCSGIKSVSGTIHETDLIVPIQDFESKSQPQHFRPYVIVRNENLAYPICVYRHAENEYSALWMRCTHQGAELQVFGNRLVCPAHGSEFSDRGTMQNGPADAPLRSFPVVVENGLLKISLKKQS